MSDTGTNTAKGFAGRLGILNVAIGILFIAIVTIYMVHLSKRPLYNSDMLSYMGIALQIKGFDAQQLHDSVYTITKAHVPAKAFVNLTSTNDGRVERYNDYRSFYDYLRYFRLKPLYVFVIKTFYDSGINLVFATILPSLIFTGGLLIAFFYGLQKLFKSNIFPFVIGLIVMLFSYTNQLVCLSTPDAMSSFQVFILFLNLFFKGKEAVSYCILALCIFTRIDNLTLLPFILYYYRFDKVNIKSLVKAFLLISAVVIIVSVVPFLFGNHTFWFIDFIYKPSVYVAMVIKSAGLMRTDFNLLFLLLAMLLFFILSNQTRLRSLFVGVVLLSCTRFLLFPSYEERFYFIFKLMIVFIGLAAFADRIQLKNNI
ncbi:MAG TPA: hypothetical protein VF623_08460, partial [Segetibacter sp.]